MSVFRLISYLAASLLLVLAGCRSGAVVPRFSAAAGYRPALPAQRFDTVTAVSTQQHPATPQRQVEAEVWPKVAGTRGVRPGKKQERAVASSSSQATPTAADTIRRPVRPIAQHEPSKQPAPKLVSAQTLVHYSLHFLFPAVLALVFFPSMWPGAYLIMLATMLMDVDHLLAKPIFEPRRCSVGYHPLHSFYAIPVYALLLLLPPPTQIVAMGMLFHVFTDTVDCFWSFRHCQECYVNSRLYALRNWWRKLRGRETVK